MIREIRRIYDQAPAGEKIPTMERFLQRREERIENSKQSEKVTELKKWYTENMVDSMIHPTDREQLVIDKLDEAISELEALEDQDEEADESS